MWRQTTMNIKNLSRQNLDSVLEYHNSPSAFWLHAYRQRRWTWNLPFLNFRPPWPWPRIGSYGIPSCITHRPLSTYQSSLKLEKFCVDRRTDGHWGGFIRGVSPVLTWRNAFWSPPMSSIKRSADVFLRQYVVYISNCSFCSTNNNTVTPQPTFNSSYKLLLLLWQAQHSTKRRHQSSEWMILSHVNYFIQGDVIGFQVLLDSLHRWSPLVLQDGSC